MAGAATRGMSTTTVRSFRAAGKKIARAARELRDDFGWRLRTIAEEILTDVKDSRPGHGVPVDKGILRSTGRCEGPTGKASNPQVEIGFGGPSAKYALVQHEVTTFRHTVGEPRYLVRGMERWNASSSPAVAAMKKAAAEKLDQEKRGG
jgi:hypothetical protein